MRTPLDINEHLSATGYYIQTGDEAATIPDDSPVLFTCPICGENYETHAEAQVCRTQPFDTQGWKIGDITIVPGAYHNAYVTPGDPWWAFTIPAIPDSDDHFDHTPKQIGYYVVTAIHTDPHDPHRVILTLARVTQGDDRGPFLMYGWNPADGCGHYSLFRVRDKQWIGGSRGWKDELKDFLDKCEPCAILQSEAAELAALGISTTSLL